MEGGVSIDKQHAFTPSEWPIDSLLAECSQLDYWMSKLVLEARERGDEPSLPDTLYSIFAGLMRYVILERPKNSRHGVETAMYRSGGFKKQKQAEPITIEEEIFLWEKGYLSDIHLQFECQLLLPVHPLTL